VVAGATLLLADFTAVLASLTARSLAATQREATIADRALAEATNQAAATNDLARIAREQLAASTRPLLLRDPKSADLIEIRSLPDKPFGFMVTFVNMGPGPAFVRQGLLMLGSAAHPATDVQPRIVPPGGVLQLLFNVDPQVAEQDAIADALRYHTELKVGAFYTDFSVERAWRSGGRLVQKGTYDWQLVDVEVIETGLDSLK
jgi:hypothetical protein